MTQKCKQCNKNFKTLTEENLCYYCHVNKYHTPPTTGVYKIINKLK